MGFLALAFLEPAPVEFAPGLSRSMAVDRSRVSSTVIDRTNLVDEGRVGNNEGDDVPSTDTAASIKADRDIRG